MNREIVSAFTELRTLDTDDIQDIGGWLAPYAETLTLRWLLAHTDDAVLWGRFEAGRLVLDDSAQGSLRLETLQVARAFGDDAEIMLWRDGDGVLRARLLSDNAGDEAWVLDEEHVLWGTQAEKLANGFTRMSEGAQGLAHVVPLTVQARYGQRHPLRLGVRHYLTEDKAGFVRIAYSRLKDVFEVGGVD